MDRASGGSRPRPGTTLAYFPNARCATGPGPRFTRRDNPTRPATHGIRMCVVRSHGRGNPGAVTHGEPDRGNQRLCQGFEMSVRGRNGSGRADSTRREVIR